MSSTISSQDNRQPAPGDAMRHQDRLRGVVTAWGPLALLSVAFAYACAGVLLHAGARPSIEGLAAPYRPIAVFLVAAAPMLVTLIVASLQRGSRIPGGRSAIRAIGIGISLPALAVATVWYFS